MTEREYWLAFAYRVGYCEGCGWDNVSDSIPDAYRTDGKDAYDRGVEDYAEGSDPE